MVKISFMISEAQSALNLDAVITVKACLIYAVNRGINCCCLSCIAKCNQILEGKKKNKDPGR